MKRLLVALLALTIAACSPFPKDEEETAKATKAKATPATPATPKPTPKPGAWMTEKRDNPLGLESNPLDKKPKK